MKSREQGAGLLIPVMLVLTVAAFGVIVAASQSGSDIQGNDAHADSIQALYVAETGVERALKRFATGTACGALLAEVINDLGTIGLGPINTYTITIGAGLSTDFSGVTALPATQCRVPVTGRINATNVSRTIHAIVDRNLLEGPDNPTFNNRTTAGAPTGWTLTPPGAQLGYAMTGGPDCSRSLWLLKAQDGAVASRSEAQTPVNFTVTGGTATTVTFHWRITNRTGAGCVAGAAAGPAWPAACLGAGGFNGQVCFRFIDALGPTTAFDYRDNATGAFAVICPDPLTTQAGYATCATGYQAGYPVKQSVTVNMAGAGVRTINNFFVNIRLQILNRREMFIDHVEATNNTAVGAAQVRVWRDCSTATNPATCL